MTTGGAGMPTDPPPRSVLPPWTSTPALHWPLIGRADVLTVAGHVGRVPGAPGLVLAGAAGVGKTRLAQELVRAATEAGAATSWALGAPGAQSVPFAAFATVAPLGEGGTRGFHDVVAALTASAGDRPLVVAVDDAHLLDPGSAALVLHLAASATATVVATLRTDQPCPDALRALWKDGYAQRVDLGPLPDDDVARLLRAALGSDVEHATAIRLAAVTGGNPLHLREVVTAGLGTGALHLHDGLWRWDGRLDSPRLTELVEARLDGLGPDERRLVELVAVGEPLPEPLLRGLTDETSLESAEAGGLLTLLGRGQGRYGEGTLVRLAHPLHGEVLRRSMPLTAVRSRHRDLAAALRGSGRRGPDDLLRMVSWSVDGGVEIEGSELLAAARVALDTHDHGRAVQLAREAARAGVGLAAAITEASAQRAMNDAAPAEATLASWEHAAAGHPLAASYLVARCQVLLGGLGRSADALALLDRARAWNADEAWREIVTALSLAPVLHQSRFAEVVDTGLPLVADETRPVLIRTLAASAVGLALVKTGRLEEALAVSDTGVALGSTPDPLFPAAAVECLRTRVAAQWSRGEWAEGEPLLRWYYDEGVRQADTAILGPTSYVLGLTALSCGDVDGASRWLREAVGHFTASDREGYLGPCLARVAHAEALAGRYDSAAAYRERARATAATRPDEWLRDVELAAADLWIEAASGRISAAVDLALATARDFSPQPSNEAFFLHQALRLGAPATLVRDRLAEISGRLDSPLVALFAAQAAADGDGAALDDVSERFAAIPARLLAAECAVAAAAAHREAGRLPAAQRSQARAEALLALCPGAATPGVRTAPSAAARLTRREREVAQLAAEGRSNADIAAHLVISERTVESHVLRACTKLGIRSREDLRTALSGSSVPSTDSSPTTRP